MKETFISQIRSKLTHRDKQESTGACLIIQTSFLGDVILATPLIEKLKRFYPDCHIDFLLRKGNEGLLEANPNLRDVLVFDKKNGKYKNLFRLVKKVRQRKYDVVINIQRYATTGMITALSGAKLTIGFNKNPIHRLFSVAVAHEMHHKKNRDHEVVRNLRLIECLTDASFEMPKLYPILDHHKHHLVTGENYYCMAPSSVWFTKQYPLANWVKLIDALPHSETIFLLGAPADSELCETLCQKATHSNIINVAGKLSLLQSADLMSGAKMNFVNDSAPLHMTSAMNAPVRAMFCSTVPAFGYTPLSNDSKVIETHHKLDCRPCNMYGKKLCPKGHFMCGDIRVEAILD